jgi:hypothetical protein
MKVRIGISPRGSLTNERIPRMLKVMKHVLPVLTLGVAAFFSADAVGQVEKGGWAPEIQVKEWLNQPMGKSLEDLRGRVVFLEFWATW